MIKILRFITILLHLFKGFFIFGFSLNNDQIISQGISVKKRQKLVKWFAQLLKICRVKVISHGGEVQAPKMIVSNHISWLDIIVLSHAYSGYFIAKSEIKKWPFMGAMITSIGTLFVQRGVRSELKKLSNQIKQLVKIKGSIIFFPEGKTGDGRQINTIYSGLFESAIDAKLDIQPILLTYSDSSGHPSKAVAYTNDKSLYASVMDILEEKEIVVHVHVLETISTDSINRKEIGTQLTKLLSLKLEQEIPNME